MASLYLVLNIAALVLLVLFVKGLIKNFNKTYEVPAKKRRFYITIALLLFLIITPNVIMRFFVSEPDFETEAQQIDFYHKYKYYLLLNDVYLDLLKKDSTSMEHHFNYVNSINQHIEKLGMNRAFDPKSLEGIFESERLEDYYLAYISSEDSSQNDIGFLFLGLHYLNLTEYEKASDHINCIRNTDLDYYHFIKGKFLSKTRRKSNFEMADSLLKLSVNRSINVKESYNELANLYFFNNKNDKLEELVKNPEAFVHLKIFPKRIVFLRTLSIVNYWKAILRKELDSLSFWGFVSSLLILLIWLFYVRKVDVFEPEKWSFTLLALFMGMCTLFLVYPIHDILWDKFSFFPSKNPIKDFVYIVLSIGAVEELVKIIPFLIILRFTKAINEPFDYILYCSVSAIGFSFIENMGYIEESSFYNINARALIASVAHIVFTSTIGYGLMLSKYRGFNKPFLFFTVFFCLASLMHGFYDFWLINEWARDYNWITTIFFIVCVHIWHLYINNTLNITTFYDPKIKMENDQLKYYLIISLFGILMYSYLLNGFTQGRSYAIKYLTESALFYGYFILYLAFSFSSFEIVRGYLAPITVPFNLLIPRINRTLDYSGMPVMIDTSYRFRLINKYQHLRTQLPSSGIFSRRLVIDDNLECYLVLLDKPISVEGCLPNMVVIIPKKKNKKFSDPGNILVYLMLIESEEVLDNPVLRKRDFRFAGWALSKRINELDRDW